MLQIDPNWPDDPQACARHPGRPELPGVSPPASLKIAPDHCQLARGSVSVRVRFEEARPDSQARIVFGYDPDKRSYLCAGIGGHKAAYVVDEWKPVPGVLSPIAVAGESPPVLEPCELQLKLVFEGRTLGLLVDGAPVITTELARTVGNGGLGLFAWGYETIVFSEFNINREPAYAVVVMQFHNFEDVYTKLIRPALQGAGLRVDRLDEHQTPQGILEDIKQSIRDADVIVAEITPKNENVFYEVGYAHASGAPTILLVRNRRKLPFDVAPERCVRYDLTEGGETAADKLVRAVREMGLTGPD